jgi:hypothetical protein
MALENNDNPPFDITMKALSVRQPYAEEIMRGIKKAEYITVPTNFRGRVYIYVSNTLEKNEIPRLKNKK